jgi:2-phospho-L-lactate guanylyltransferase (CobY/MobA/RfbA family)
VISDTFVIPLKRFDLAKERLRVNDATSITELARHLATRVIESCAPRHTIVLAESDEIAQFASREGCEVLRSDAADLNDAVQRAYGALQSRFERIIVVHGDLRHPEGLGEFNPGVGITIVTDHHGLGTNVMALPVGLDFHFAYGANSSFLHQREAERVGCPLTVVIDSPWCFDVDEPGDLDL